MARSVSGKVLKTITGIPESLKDSAELFNDQKNHEMGKNKL